MLAKTNSFKDKIYVCQQNPRRLQIQCNNIKDNDDVKLLLVYIGKMENTADVGTLASAKAMIGRRKLDVSIRNEI